MTPRRQSGVAAAAVLLGALSASVGADVDYAPVMARNGMVASAHPIASAAGIDILKRGGNAFDAAVAVTALLGVVEPGSSGIAGEGFALFRIGKTGELKALNWTTRSPVSTEFAERRRELNEPDGIVRLVPPGTVGGLVELLQTHGTMSLADVLAPSITYAEEGLVVSERLHDAIKRMAPTFRKHPDSARIYLVNGEAPPVGSVLRNPDMARTLRAIVAKGKDAFYKGEVAQEILRYFKESGGLISQKDLDLASQPKWLTPIKSTYRGHTVYAVPPNAGGVMLLEALNILEGFDVAKSSDAERVHLLAETFKLVFEDRETKVGDPDRIQVPVDQLISKPYASERRAFIKPDAVMPWRVSGITESGTTHLAVADKDGNVISITNTHNGFSRVIGRTGLFFNNAMSNMSLNPKHPNFAEPGKRMMKNLSPALVFNPEGKLVLAVGAAGGSTIWQTVSQTIVNFIDRGRNVQQAITDARITYSAPGARLMVDDHAPADVIRALQSLGHQAQVRDAGGSVQAISIDPISGAYSGGADPRRDGKPAGY
jgi:gamma-glutamyltranspeptidase / glutathione hydrolase